MIGRSAMDNRNFSLLSKRRVEYVRLTTFTNEDNLYKIKVFDYIFVLLFIHCAILNKRATSLMIAVHAIISKAAVSGHFGHFFSSHLN